MLKRLYSEFVESPTSIKIAITAVVAVWTAVLMIVIVGAILFMEKPGQALQPTPGAGIPGIMLEPTGGPVGTSVAIQGVGWNPGDMVLIYLVAPGQTEPPSYATAGSVADAEGRLTVRFIVPSEPGWENGGLATVIARTTESGASAQAFFNVLSSAEQPTATATASVEPAATPTPTLEAPTPTPQPGNPMATSTTDLNIRGGPGALYPVLGILRAGQSAEITGVSADSGWWQIRFSGTADGRAWISANYVTAQNTQDVPVVQAPPLPASPTPTPVPTSTPTPTPMVIHDWRGEYYASRDLNGNPLLVRNDPAINFDWGTGAPAAGLPADSFSVRWSRNLSFPAGTYRFYTRVDDGVRLWVDGALVIDQWHDSAATTYSADVNLSEGGHSLRMEYYDHNGDALAQLAWERVENYPDWKVEYYDNRKLEGDPVLVRNETKIDHDWGKGSPASGVPADNFSARWTRKVDFERGTYRVSVRVDDGVRLWVGDTLVIDSWRDGSSRLIEAERQISEGKQRVKVEYYERSGDALIEVSWKRVEKQANQSPQAIPGGPYYVDEGSLVTFDGGASKDPDGSITKYEWDYAYNGSDFVADSVGQTASTSYPDGPATVVIALRVTDDKGATTIATTQVQVKNVAPTAEAGGPYVGEVGVPISMAGTGSDPGSVDQAGLSYAWDFGDGAQAGGSNVSHSYAQPGSYTVRLTITDKDGARGRDTATVQVTAPSQPPTAVISGPSQGMVGETLSFRGKALIEGRGSIVSYDWDFGDGNTGKGATIDHVYDMPGDYQVSLTVTADSGLTGRAVHAVHISSPAPVNQPPTAVISGPSQGMVGETLSFSGDRSSDVDGSITSYAWDFGDGGTASGVNVDHAYQQVGIYQISLTVTDDSGLAGETTHPIQIDEVAPANLPPTEFNNGG